MESEQTQGITPPSDISSKKSSSQEHPFVRRKSNLGERIIERGIALVGGIAVVLIFLILLFVLRESIPLFFQPESKAIGAKSAQTDKNAQKASNDETLKPDIYNPDIILNSAESETIFVPEVYNPDVSLPTQVSSVSASAPVPEEEQDESISLANVLGNAWQPVSTRPKFGILPLIIGTAKTTIVAVLIGAPLGILAALYAAFFVPRRLKEFIKPMVEMLAGLPSVVIGFFCLMTIGSFLQTLFGLDFRLNAVVGGIGLSIAVIPIVFTITEDALSAVPKSLLEASLAMGATTWESAYKVMLPAAFPGVFAAVLLGIGRAFGETMIALMATGNAAMLSASFADPVRTFSATIGAEMGEVIWGSPHYSMLFFLGVLLFLFSFTLNAITELFIKERLAKKLQGG
ncbi:MAG: phosphate ABC transporter permease subunit PstC [Candidatus Kapaibacterium sp.]|nr:MAG: phosphate ABC transporter permease subunit PstC [Candidatus Kapabacteria bacterium]